MELKIDPETGLGDLFHDKEDILGYQNISRLDILCGFKHDYPTHACELCKSKDCRGKGKCKGFGAYSLGIKIYG